jgi:hypothetical protein
MESKYIYLVFAKTGTWLSRLICTFSEIEYAHSSISFDNSFKKMYSFGRINPDNPFSGGFVQESLFDGVYKKFSKCECLIYKVLITEEQYYALENQIEKFMNEKDRYKYNFIGLFGILLNLRIKRENHYFCSQFISEILMECNIHDFQKTPELMKTTDLFKIKNKEIIWEGRANEYFIVPGSPNSPVPSMSI